MRSTGMLVAVLLGGLASAGQDASALPEIYAAEVELTQSGPTVRVEITIDAWTDNDVRADLAEALQAAGTRGLVEEMGTLDVGRLQVRDGEVYRLRVASTWEGEQGRHVRIATDRPLILGTRSSLRTPEDYPFGIAEFVLPRKGPGEGSLLPAARLRFDDDGRLVVQAPPGGSDLQTVTSVEQHGDKRKRGKREKR